MSIDFSHETSMLKDKNIGSPGKGLPIFILAFFFLYVSSSAALFTLPGGGPARR